MSPRFSFGESLCFPGRHELSACLMGFRRGILTEWAWHLEGGTIGIVKRAIIWGSHGQHIGWLVGASHEASPNRL
jgi:hypothetical protein